MNGAGGNQGDGKGTTYSRSTPLPTSIIRSEITIDKLFHEVLFSFALFWK